MKKWLHNLWENISESSFIVLGCGLMLFIILGAVYILNLLCQWLWTFDWVKNSLRAIGTFFSDNALYFEYFFVGALLLYLLITFVLWLYRRIKNGYNYAIAHDFFGRTKRLFINIAKIFLVIIVVLGSKYMTKI